jgi:NAD(P)-dependent dehydrogenase (short-subunit alcohol dehydrogenase family)
MPVPVGCACRGLTGALSACPVPACTAAKGAVVNLSRELGLEYARQGMTGQTLVVGAMHGQAATGNPEWIPTPPLRLAWKEQP